MKKLIYLFPIIAVCCFACNNPQKDKEAIGATADTAITSNTGAPLDTNKLDTNVVSFFENAALGSMVEIESSTKIEKLTQNPQIKMFAAMMTKDHGTLTQKLKTLAAQKGFDLPQVLPASKLTIIGKLDQFKDEARNDYYVKLMINEHKNAINLFSMGERSSDASVAKFATDNLPTIRAHYEHILKIDTLLQKPKANQGDDPLKISDRKKQ